MRSDREERIRQRAYTIWQSEGHQHGRHEDHWQRAEREIAAEEAAGGKAARRAAGWGKAGDAKPAMAGSARSRNANADTLAQKPATPATRPTRTRKPASED